MLPLLAVQIKELVSKKPSFQSKRAKQEHEEAIYAAECSSATQPNPSSIATRRTSEANSDSWNSSDCCRVSRSSFSQYLPRYSLFVLEYARKATVYGAIICVLESARKKLENILCSAFCRILIAVRLNSCD